MATRERIRSQPPVILMLGGSVLLVAALIGFLVIQSRATGNTADRLTVYCAAGLRYAMEDIAAKYGDEYDVEIELQYGGSHTLLSQIEVARMGDIYLAADESYIETAREKALAEESIPLARMVPVLAVRRGNPLGIESLADLLETDARLGMGNPDAAAIGKKCRRLLQQSGDWAAIERLVRDRGVFKPTVNDVANDIKLGSVDAGLIWDSTVAQYDELEAIRIPELDAGESLVEIALLTSCSSPPAALHFMRYVAAQDRGLQQFADSGFDVVEGDVWAERPQLTFFAGAVNRRALEPVIQAFEEREGVEVTRVYNGCGILTGTMRQLRQNQQSGFPDTYMACDVYYLEQVADWFQEAVEVSDTDIVLVVQPGNPKGLRSLEDLLGEGVRVVLGQPEQCTIGVLSRRLLEREGIYEELLRTNVVSQAPSSALLIPAVTTGAADAVLAYRSDTLEEAEKLEVIPLDSELAAAVQPFSIAKSSEHKYLSRRLFQAIARSRSHFEDAGFHFRLPDEHSGESPRRAPDTGPPGTSQPSPENTGS